MVPSYVRRRSSGVVPTRKKCGRPWTLLEHVIESRGRLCFKIKCGGRLNKLTSTGLHELGIPVHVRVHMLYPIVHTTTCGGRGHPFRRTRDEGWQSGYMHQ